MIDLRNIQNDYIACGYTDMRKQMDGLVAVVQLLFHLELDEVSLFLFCGRKADRVKALYWDGTGYVHFQRCSRRSSKVTLPAAL